MRDFINILVCCLIVSNAVIIKRMYSGTRVCGYSIVNDILLGFYMTFE